MDSNISSNKKKGLFPLLKGLRPSQSTPIKTGEEVAHINFYKNDENFIYATDAVVEHPLRIGAGYGSYICYSCTVYSDKVKIGYQQYYFTNTDIHIHLHNRERQLLSLNATRTL